MAGMFPRWGGENVIARIMICLADTKIIVHKRIHVGSLLGPDFVSLIYINARSMARQCWYLLGIPPSHLKRHLLFHISAKYMDCLLFSILCHVINNGNECLLNDSCTGCSCKIHGHTFLSFPIYLTTARTLDILFTSQIFISRNDFF